MAESKGFFRGCHLSRLALLVAAVGKKQSTGLFSSESLWLSPSLFESLFIIKKQNHPKGWLCFLCLWATKKIFSAVLRMTSNSRKNLYSVNH
ncbi:hypothetical protein, partial [uncultured Eubacterium sp.]|uniref:hypothetical protein n=1 Tax=uncultured Eubacterium sp. TaxID=165185 RepID=UPI002804F6E8